MRIQIVYSLLQEDESSTLHFIASLLLFDGRDNEGTFEMMNHEGCFPRLLELLKEDEKGDARLHRLLLELLYEMSRMQRVSVGDLAQVVDDPYHYPVIRVLVTTPSLSTYLSPSLSAPPTRCPR